jgi:peptidyl-prolyl cis-trans isomerase C
MNTKKTAGLVGGVALLILAAFFGPQVFNKATAGDDLVVAKIDDMQITKKEVLEAIKTLPVQGDLNLETMFPIITDQMINEKLVSRAADRANLAQDPDVVKQMEEARTQIIRAIFLQRQVEQKVTDADVQKFYDDLKQKNAGKQETKAHHVLVKTEAEAQDVIKALEAGAKIEDLAAEKSIDPSAKSNKGDLGYFQEDAMVPEFSKAAFALAPGEFTKTPVQTQFGFHVIKVDDRRTVQIPELETVRDQIRSKLAQDALSALVLELRKEAKIEKFDMEGKPVPDTLTESGQPDPTKAAE